MRRILVTTICITILMLLLGGCNNPSLPEAEIVSSSDNGGKIVLGDISDEPAETIKGTQPIADYIVSQLSDYNITTAEVKIAPDLDTMIQMMADGEVDIYFDSPYPALVVSAQTGAQPILRRQKYGVPEYHSIFFTRKDTGLTSADDLMGQMIAFEESFSTSGYMLPLSYLIEQGMNPVEKEDLDAPVSEDEVGFVFSTADNTTIQWVVSGRVPIGVIDNITYDLFVPEETKDELVILAHTEDVPRQVVLVRAGMDADLVAAIEAILLDMDTTEAGRAVLEIFLTSEFDEFPEGAEAALARMQTLYQLVQK